MKVGSLFSGIGGFDLGLERAGFSIEWQVEIDEYATRVLTKHWPNVPKYGDIRSIDWSTVAPVDVLCGGFPCQDLSYAGERAGLREGTRSGLWFEYLRAIRSLRPKYILVENVSGLLDNHALGRVLGDLAESGYDAEWDCIRAYNFGLPMQRDRVWIISYPSRFNGRKTSVLEPSRFRRTQVQFRRFSSLPTSVKEIGEWENDCQPRMVRKINGVSSQVDRLKGLGNAVVPQIVEALGKMIMEVEHGNHERGIRA